MQAHTRRRHQLTAAARGHIQVARQLFARLMAHVLGPKPPPLGAGVAVVALFVVAETLLVDTLAPIAAGSALATVYLPGVLVVSTLWGWWLGAVTAAASAAVFNVIHVLPMADRAELDKLGMIGMTGQPWLAFTVLLAVGLLRPRERSVRLRGLRGEGSRGCA